jgi:hypothetical protein
LLGEKAVVNGRLVLCAICQKHYTKKGDTCGFCRQETGEAPSTALVERSLEGMGDRIENDFNVWATQTHAGQSAVAFAAYQREQEGWS